MQWAKRPLYDYVKLGCGGDQMNLKKILRKPYWALERRWYERYINLGNSGRFVFVDVGSVGWLPEPWKRKENIQHIKHLIRFDPNEGGCYETEKVRTYNKALWSKNCALPLYEQYGSSSGSTLYEQNIEYVKDNFDAIVKSIF